MHSQTNIRLTASFTPSSLSSLSSSPSLHMNLTAFLHALLSHTFHFFRHAIILLLFVITFKHGIYNYTPETNHLSTVYSIAAVLNLQFMVHVMLLSKIKFYNFRSVLYYYYYYYYYYYHHHHHHHHHHRNSLFSALAGKYSPVLGCGNQQD